ncbi:MAG: fumarylacetoacetate hydrolase family protein [Cyclobacteriaceae bacterium]
MKLLRFGDFGKEKPGVLLNNEMVDLSAFGENYDEHFFETDGIGRLGKWLSTQTNLPKIKPGTRLGSPFVRPSKIICVGLNYKKHAAETNMPLPTEPILFFKSTSALVGPNDGLIIPKKSEKTDWEVELAIVISKKTSYIEEKDALDHIAGFCLHNDYSERAFQLERSGQWAKGKGCDTFAPIGPYLVTKDEVDFNNLRLWLKVNGKMMQDSNTDDMVFSCTYLVSYISQFMTLLPGDVISTGTPEGVGMGLKPPMYLKAGDVIELGIEGLGEQKQIVEAHS